MQHKSIQVTGLVLTAIYAAFIIWVYATEPRTFREVANSASVAAGSYQVDQERFNAALALFRRRELCAPPAHRHQAVPAPKDAPPHSFNPFTCIPDSRASTC